MLTESSKVALRVSAVALVLGVVYGVATSDRAGTLLLLTVFAGAGLLGAVLAAARESEVAPVPPDAGPPEMREVTPPPLCGGGGWGMAAAVAVTLLALSFVVGPAAAVGAVAVGTFALVGWTARVSGEHTGRPVNLLPLGLPVVGLFAIAALIFFMSRILLAVPQTASTAFALVVALLILGGATLVAVRPNVTTTAAVAMLAGAGAFLVVGGAVAAAVGERPVHKKHHEPSGLTVVAKNNAFTTKELSLDAGAPVLIRFKNADTAIPHNVAIYTGPDAAQSIFVGDIVVGPITVDYQFPAPAPGSYFFRCDIHPNMQGAVTVAPPGGGHAPAPPTGHAA